MYELCRVRLFSVGPAGARYSDVILDFRHVGAPIKAPAQEALFETGPVEIIRRPSPASVLFLENGGGKSVLIKLIFSVMLPGRRQVVGTTNTRVLEKFVRASDVAHVLLEWQHTETGTRVVTGKVSEWRGHVESTDPAKLVDAWYSFRPTAEFTLDDLPLMDSGRLVTLSGFRERFTEAHRQEPVLQAVWETGHADWSAHLANLGLDTELFRYQRAMNAGEGEAAEAFTFRTDDAFVDFLLRAVIDEEDPRGLAEVVEGYAHKLAQRAALTAEREFVAGAIDRLVPLASKHDQAVAAHKLAADARARARRFHTALALRYAAEEERLAVAEERQRVLAEAEQQADRELSRLGAVVLELRRLVAGMQLYAAEREKSALDKDLNQARTRAGAWRQTETVLRGLATSNKAEGLRRLVGEREERARPALRARNDTARALARGLLEVAARAEAAAGEADREAQALLKAEGKASREYADALRTAERERAKAREFEARIAEVRDAVQDRVRVGLLSEGADVLAEAELAAEAAEQAEATLTWAIEEGDRLAAAVKAASTAWHQAQRAADAADKLASAAATAAAQAVDRADSLAGRPRLAELLGVDEHLLTDRIGDVIDEASGQRKEPKRDGTSLLLRGVHAAVPKGFRVEMLKPDAVLRTERLRVSEIRDVFSGGQQLTAAIILYCTLAALRANDRGRARQRHAGVLFLDNPIGRASAGYLLELQLAVAETLGVQLVYTTGLFDAGALSVFPLIIRLRNDADLRAGLKYLSVDSTIRRELAALGEPDGTARVAATRVFVRPGQPSS
jgi:hypothetical protein